jgi:medium-chain acyl-[acyl-carrier-protein] hydrolase
MNASVTSAIPGIAESFVCFAPSRTVRRRLFCFPYVGGGSVSYRTWSNDLTGGRGPAPTSADVEVWALQLPGRERRIGESPLTSLGAIVQTLAPAFVQGDDVPFAFFGHSMGGLIAFELARELRRRRVPGPAILFASGCSAPQIRSYVDPPRSVLTEAALIDELCRLGGTPPAVLANEELRALLFPSIRADFHAVDTYRFAADEPPLDCRIVALGGSQDVECGVEKLEPWSIQTTGGFRLQFFEGDHFFVHTRQQSVVELVETELAPMGRAFTA